MKFRETIAENNKQGILMAVENVHIHDASSIK